MEPRDFAVTIESWHDFYMLIGTAAATLTGLLLIALSINLAKLHLGKYNDLRVLAYRTFYNFIYLLIVAGVMLIPHQTVIGVGIPLFVIGAIGILNSFRGIRSAMKGEHSWGMRDIMRRFAIGFVLLLLQTAIAIVLLSGEERVLYVLPGVMLLHLLFASDNAWDLFIRQHEE